MEYKDLLDMMAEKMAADMAADVSKKIKPIEVMNFFKNHGLTPMQALPILILVICALYKSIGLPAEVAMQQISFTMRWLEDKKNADSVTEADSITEKDDKTTH